MHVLNSKIARITKKTHLCYCGLTTLLVVVEMMTLNRYRKAGLRSAVWCYGAVELPLSISSKVIFFIFPLVFCRFLIKMPSST